MTLDNLSIAILALTDDAAHDLVDALEAWKKDDSPVGELRARIDAYLAVAQFANDAHQREVVRLWEHFKRTIIDECSGMTMLEKLGSFSLLQRWDLCLSSRGQKALYAKVSSAND